MAAVQDRFTAHHDYLAPDGLLVFELNTLATYGGFFSDLLVDPSPDDIIVWTGRTGGEPTPSAVASATLAGDRTRRSGRGVAFVAR